MIQRVERGEPIQKWVPTYRLYELCARERGTLTLLHLFRPRSFGLPAPVYMNWHPFSLSSCPLPPNSFSPNNQKGTSKKVIVQKISSTMKNGALSTIYSPTVLYVWLPAYILMKSETNNTTRGDPSSSPCRWNKPSAAHLRLLIYVRAYERAGGRANVRLNRHPSIFTYR